MPREVCTFLLPSLDLLHSFIPVNFRVADPPMNLTNFGLIPFLCRWFNHLSPEVRKEAWTSEEDRVIIESHRQLGNKWTAISRLLNGRPANAIKNHWNSTLKRQVQFGAEIGSGSPRPGKRQRATVGHQSRKKRRLDVSSYESGKFPLVHILHFFFLLLAA
jgi:hypothetical protein